MKIFAGLITPMMLLELRAATERNRDRNRLQQTYFLAGNVVLLLLERVWVLDGNNYGCLSAAGKRMGKKKLNVILL